MAPSRSANRRGLRLTKSHSAVHDVDRERLFFFVVVTKAMSFVYVLLIRLSRATVEFSAYRGSFRCQTRCRSRRFITSRE